MKKGKVYLVGAGPGDAGLITRRGLEYLAEADVIIYDHLLDDQLLNLARQDAEKIYAGKSGSVHNREQFEINQLLVEKAREGKIVVRLKGGDPFVLGRGGEEAEELANCNIPFEIIPGITSAVAVPAYAGIPVTHRGLASSFAVITGHEEPGKPDSSIKWSKLATGVDTLVFLMGMQNLLAIVDKLLENGRAGGTPVAVIENGTRPDQKTVVGQLKNIVGKVKEQGLRPPAIVVVGEVVSLRDKLRWFDNRPLSGKRILVTRARHQASVLSRLLAEHGAQAVELPVIDIQPLADTAELDRAIINLSRYHWIIFTSVNGVEAFFRQLHSLKLDSRALSGIKIGAIGPATAGALEMQGLAADYCPAIYSGEGIVAGLKADGVQGKRFLLPRADIADEELAKGISRLGGEVDEVAVYNTVPDSKAAGRIREILSSGEIDVIMFTSSSTVSNFIAALPGEGELVSKSRIACIGPKTAETVARAGLRVDIVAAEYTIPGLVAAIVEYFSKET